MPLEKVEKLGVIGGSGLLKSSLFSSGGGNVATVSTEFGDVLLRSLVLELGTSEKLNIIFVQRHAASPNLPYAPPHLINHRACAAARCALKV